MHSPFSAYVCFYMRKSADYSIRLPLSECGKVFSEFCLAWFIDKLLTAPSHPDVSLAA